ncbi:type II secretion system protein [Halobacillus seohaensis]|uniref:Type II secretion system protein n=1 Tax=Halobacillus seohaensis TaxID=447421 RepID=A0ABW2EKZ8_9BACI
MFKDKGFTLIEVLAAITLLGLVTTVFLAVFLNYAASSNRVETELDATNIAEEVGYYVSTSEEILNQWTASCSQSETQQSVDISSLASINGHFDTDNSNRLYYTSSQNQTYDLEVNLCQSVEEKGLVVRINVEVYRSLTSGELSLVTETYHYVREEATS